MARMHLVLTLAWTALVIPTLLWWSESVLWIALMSIYANVVGHWGSYQAAHAEEKLLDVCEGKKEGDNARP